MWIFKDGGPLDPTKDQKVFVDRKEISQILQHLRNGHKYISIASPRSTGKTTLLYKIYDQLGLEGYSTVYIDLIPYSRLEEANFYNRLTKEINNSLANQLVQKTGQQLITRSVNDHFALREYLNQICQAGENIRKIIILLDEVGGVPDALAFSFFSQLRWIFTQSKLPSNAILNKLTFVLAGAIDLAKLHEDRNSPLRNVCEEFTLEDFSAQDVSRLVSNLTKLSLEEQGGIANQIFNWTDGHPYLTQRICVLIERSSEYNNGKIYQPEKFINDFVEKDILYGKIQSYFMAYIFKHLRSEKRHENIAFQILNGKKWKSQGIADFLDIIGVIKRGDDRYFRIRNRIIEKALKDYFDENLQLNQN